MSRHIQPFNGKGSLKCIQLLVNEYPQLLNQEIVNATGLSSLDVRWVSPLKGDGFAEYRDGDFLSKLGLNDLSVPLTDFWPKRGPQWDALGRADSGEIFLVEAKANIPEIVSKPTGAKAKSLDLIRKSLAETKDHIKSNSTADWSSDFYQYTNRLAHLYYLRVLNQVPAYLVFIYFIGDRSVKGPEHREMWVGAIEVMEQYLGIKKKHNLDEYILKIFIDVKDIGILP